MIKAKEMDLLPENWSLGCLWTLLFGRNEEIMNLAILLVSFLGSLSDPFKGLSDLQLGDEKGTLNHLEAMFCG